VRTEQWERWGAPKGLGCRMQGPCRSRRIWESCAPPYTDTPPTRPPPWRRTRASLMRPSLWRHQPQVLLPQPQPQQQGGRCPASPMVRCPLSASWAARSLRMVPRLALVGMVA